jgi:hypothetical protein
MYRVAAPLEWVAAVLLAGAAIAACGSAGHSGSTVAGGGGSNPSQATRAGLSFSACMRSHGVPSFPDPTANGATDFNDVPGINASSPAFKNAETACRSLLPVKQVPSTAPTPQAFTRLVHWAVCMRAHGVSGLPDPRPDPPPAGGSPGAARYGTLMGDGGYWVGIPFTVNAHSPAFMRLSTRCGESPNGHPG